MKVDPIASSGLRPLRAAATVFCALALSAWVSAGASPERQGAESARDPSYVAANPMPLPDGIRIPYYSRGPIPFHSGEELVYQASWIGIPAAGGTVTMHADAANPALLSGEIWISTNRLTDKLYRMRDYLREDFTDSLKPSRLYIRQQESRRRDTYDASFDHRGHLVRLIKHGPRGTQTREFLSNNPSGPISGSLMALTQPLKVGDSLCFDAFSGTTRYVLRLDVARRERISTPLGEFDAFRIVPSVEYLSNGKISDKVHDTMLWVSADAQRLPLRIESAVFIGRVRIDLVKVVNGPASQEGRRSAQRSRIASGGRFSAMASAASRQ